MKKCKFLPLVLGLVMAFVLLSAPALAVDDLSLGASAAILVNTETGEVYFEKNADRQVQPASTTKIVTAMLVLEAVARGEIHMTDMVTAYDDCQYNMDETSSHANPAIVPGEMMTVEDLLYCAMLASANEACNILAEYTCGSIDAFIGRMNERVGQIGCTGTHFSNANGIEDANHYSTARDFSLIAREALKLAEFQRICGTAAYTVEATNVAEARELTNTNLLINPDSDYYLEYAYGVKTGFFTNAGYCLVSAAARDDIDVVCVVMGALEPGDQFRDSLTAFNWMFSQYEYRQILGSAETLLTAEVAMGSLDSTGIRALNTVSAILPRDYDTSNIKLQYILYHEQEGRTLEAPVNAGEVLGEVSVVELDDYGNVIRTFGSTSLVATTTVEMSRLEYLRSHLGETLSQPRVRTCIIVLIAVVAVYLLIVIIYRVQRARHRSSMRAAKRDRARRIAEEEAKWLDIPGSGYDEGEAFMDEWQEPELPPPEESANPYVRPPEGARPRAQGGRQSEPAPRRQDEPAPRGKHSQDDGWFEEEEPAPRRSDPRGRRYDDDYFDSFFGRH